MNATELHLYDDNLPTHCGVYLCAASADDIPDVAVVSYVDKELYLRSWRFFAPLKMFTGHWFSDPMEVCFDECESVASCGDPGHWSRHVPHEAFRELIAAVKEAKGAQDNHLEFVRRLVEPFARFLHEHANMRYPYEQCFDCLAVPPPNPQVDKRLVLGRLVSALGELSIPFSLTKTIAGSWCVTSCDARIYKTRPKLLDCPAEAVADFMNDLPQEVFR